MLALVGGRLTGADRQVLERVRGAARRRARAGAALGGRGPGDRAHAGERAPHRVAPGGVARPAHAARVDQGVGVEPAPARHRPGRPKTEAEFLETIEEETDRLTALVSNLLDMSRLQAGVLQPTLRPVNLEEVVPAAIASLGERAYGVVMDVPETLSPVRADAALLERVVANLVENAMRWSPADRPARVTAGRVHDRVDLRIIDHGPGIKQADREQRVPAVPAARRPRRQRRGPRARGRSRLRTRDGGRADHRGHARRRHDGGREPGRGAVTLVLAVDDEPQLLRALITNLRARGYEVDGATTGEIALEMAARHHPDVVVLDLGLPDA